jgi:hypothetical protein
MKVRTPEQVLDDHLERRVAGDLETDLRRNYAGDVILLTCNSEYVGHGGIRASAARLREQLPDVRYEFVAKKVHGPYALLVWRADSHRFQAIEGSDTFVIRDGKIKLQTIHYGLRPEPHIYPESGGASK